MSDTLCCLPKSLDKYLTNPTVCVASPRRIPLAKPLATITLSTAIHVARSSASSVPWPTTPVFLSKRCALRAAAPPLGCAVRDAGAYATSSLFALLSDGSGSSWRPVGWDVGDMRLGGTLVTYGKKKIWGVEIQSSDFCFAAACMMVFHLLSPSILMPAASPGVWPSDSPRCGRMWLW